VFPQIIQAATQAASVLSSGAVTSHVPPAGTTGKPEEKGASYWAKGTGFGTGSTTSSWDADQALLRQKSEEKHVTCLLSALSSYIRPEPGHAGGSSAAAESALPAVLYELLAQSCLVPAMASYLRNDSGK